MNHFAQHVRSPRIVTDHLVRHVRSLRIETDYLAQLARSGFLCLYFKGVLPNSILCNCWPVSVS